MVEGGRFFDASNYPEALRYYQDALSRLRWVPFAQKDRVTTLSNIGYAWFEKGDYDEARRSYEAALHIDPNYVAALQGIGDICFETGSYEETTAYYSKVLVLSPQDRNSYYQRGRAYKARGLYSEALKDFRSAIRIAQNDQETLAEIYDVLQNEKLTTDDARRDYLIKAGFDDVQVTTILQAKGR